ncbi:hypothetical protein [Plebeiibacterium marinum]|uniref:Uncharacterized protein n=1 Tax=Plebeiibacterium marinum TaxID=2992111 RepID=A0AAE3MEQ2_9BACT|nr:hypothetical protein [Plebeiobacterium marinum]MCW3806247.1 hypothetical protein [Plebeiobacterium marinum]
MRLIFKYRLKSVTYTIKLILFVLSVFVYSNFTNAQKTLNDTIKQQPTSIQNLLKQNKDSSFVYSKLYEWLVVSKDSNLNASKLILHFERENKKYNQKIIRKINTKQISPFAKNILDTVGFSTNTIEKKLSSLRFQTKKSIINNALTFKNGELLNLQDIKDSERILRSFHFISDALILIEPANADTSLVDILILTQDNYPYGFNTSISTQKANISIFSKNVLGYGFEMRHIFDTEKTSNRNFGFQENIDWSNIFGSDLSIFTHFSDIFESHYFRIGLSKEFLTPDIKYAGGIDIKRNYKFQTSNNSSYLDNYDYLYQDYWIGKSFLVNTPGYFNRSNFGILGQVMLKQYYHMPDSISSMPTYLPNYYLFGSLAFNKRNYYKNRLVYNYGRTEDVPYGFLTSVSFGFNNNPKKNRIYLGTHLSLGTAIVPNKGYLYFSGDINSFFYKRHPETTVLKLGTRYISSLNKVGNNHLRNFISIDYTRGMHLQEEQYLYLRESSKGIRSYNSKRLKGNQKCVINSENVLFTKKEVLGFKIVPYTFFDFGWLTQDDVLFSSKPYYSLGIGVRMRNDHLVFNTIQFQFAYFPRIPPNGVSNSFRLSGEDVGKFNHFDFTKPYSNIFK